MLYPLTFEPILKERIWGGRNLERLYGKPLPPGKPIGESWEITDRPEGTSVIANGPLIGRDLRWLMEHHQTDLLGDAQAPNGRFPLLIKILDAQSVLSLQVHPPAPAANRLGGEPKTEMWYIADATPTAELYVGLKHGVTRPEFEQRVRDGTVAGCFHKIHVRRGDAMFLPSGRVHAIGAGNVIFEIQQNSDTTYRVFDWNRVDDQGKPRELHIDESLQSIDFDDYEPGLVNAEFKGDSAKNRVLVDDPLFWVREHQLPAGARVDSENRQARIIAVLSGGLKISGGGESVDLCPGRFCLLPAALDLVHIEAVGDAVILETGPGKQA